MAMIRSSFEAELNELNLDMIEMGSRIETAISDSIRAFKHYDLELCKKIRKSDKKIDELEKTIESKCLWLIAREQPIASDLRKITTALKIITDMERIGDNATDIANLTMRIDDKNAFADSGHIPQMAAVAVSMVHDAVSAYVNCDLELAQKTQERDDEVDEYFNLIKMELIDIFKSEGHNMDNAIDFLLIAKYLERIGDHAGNICEWVHFSQTGTHKNTRIF